MLNLFNNKLSKKPNYGSLEFRLFFSFIIVLLPLFAIFISLEQNNDRLADTNHWVNHTKVVIATASQLNFVTKKLESESRGYIITGWPSFKKAYEVNTDVALHRLEDLKRLTADQVRQREHLKTLEELLQKRLNYTGLVFKTRKENGFEEARKLFERGYGISLTSKIRMQIEKIQALEQTFLYEREENNRRALEHQQNIITTLKIVFGIVIIIAGIIIVNSLRAKKKLELELLEINTGLEKKVEDRTRMIIEHEAHFKNILDSMMEGVQILDFDYRYIYMNNSVEKHARINKAELLGNIMTEKYPGIENTDMFEKLSRCMNERVPAFMENKFVYADGSEAWFELSIQPVPDGVFILSIEITERKQAESELKKLTEELEERVKERTEQLDSINKELESFSYSVSHDLRAPLRAMDGYAKIMLEDYAQKLDEEGERILKVIVKNATQMGMLIDDLLNFSRVGKQNILRSEVKIEEIVLTVAEEIKNVYPEQKIEFTVGKLPVVFADRSMMKVVLNNLISNAVKYSSKKEYALIEVDSYEIGNQYVIVIKDNGAGFDMNYYDKLFGVFQRLHSSKEFPGTGVGLALVQRIVTRHGGRVWAKGQVNEGATFYFSIPFKN